VLTFLPDHQCRSLYIRRPHHRKTLQDVYHLRAELPYKPMPLLDRALPNLITNTVLTS